MLRLATKIKINKYVFTGCIHGSIRKSYTTFTNTAEIELPNIVYKKTNKNVGQAPETIDTLIKRGDPVWIYCGYDKPFDELPLRFTGFVSGIDADQRIMIKCEDYSYVLKQINIKSKLLKNTTIKELIDHSLSGVNINIRYDIPSATKIGDFKISNSNYLNVMHVLDELKEKFGITSYFEGKTLIVGKFIDINATEITILFQASVIEDNLQYRKDDDLSQVVKGVSILPNNDKIVRYAYKELGVVKTTINAVKGEQITLNYYNLTAAQLEDTIKNNFANYVYTGYHGSFETFLDPVIEPLNKIKLFNLRFPERNGKYKIRGVETTFGIDGGRQNVELDYRLS